MFSAKTIVLAVASQTLVVKGKEGVFIPWRYIQKLWIRKACAAL